MKPSTTPAPFRPRRSPSSSGPPLTSSEGACDSASGEQTHTHSHTHTHAHARTHTHMCIRKVSDARWSNMTSTKLPPAHQTPASTPSALGQSRAERRWQLVRGVAAALVGLRICPTSPPACRETRAEMPPLHRLRSANPFNSLLLPEAPKPLERERECVCVCERENERIRRKICPLLLCTSSTLLVSSGTPR